MGVKGKKTQQPGKWCFPFSLSRTTSKIADIDMLSDGQHRILSPNY